VFHHSDCLDELHYDLLVGPEGGHILMDLDILVLHLVVALQFAFAVVALTLRLHFSVSLVAVTVTVTVTVAVTANDGPFHFVVALLIAHYIASLLSVAVLTAHGVELERVAA